MILTACSGRAGAVPAIAPSADAAVVRACERLTKGLPDSLGKGLSRRKTTPESALTAAWGSPPAVLRCGVPVEPGYQAGDQVIEVEAGAGKVGWYAVTRGNQVFWSTPRATVHVELIVPVKYQGAGLLARLTPAVSALGVF